MAVRISSFGTFPDGREVKLYTMENKNGMRVAVTNIGAALVRVEVPDSRGRMADVVLGFDRAEDYLVNGCFFGAVIGPNANRIGKAAFCLDGTEYSLAANDGVNNLHSDRNLGWHKRFWEADPGEESVTFRLEDGPDNMGFPGAKTAEVTYSLNDENELRLHYHAASDKRTILNLTNHSYFNLEGHDSGSIEGHELWLGASCYTPADAGSIPTGEIAGVEGTPMDFTAPGKIGAQIDAEFPQLQFAGGYDHNWVIDGWDGTLRRFATVKAPVSGRFMEVYTTLPGVQFYAGNFIQEEKGKGAAVYRKRGGLCLETQYFPDSVNKPAFPPCIFGGEKEYDSVTVYRFGAQ
ncbi:MAG: galactose mutarotase [Lachnospiraceae bacterium]|nr:galactose mutarotase [Lachnospiraceae bacterium]